MECITYCLILKDKTSRASTFLSYLCYSFFPAFNDLAMSNLELEGLVPVSRGVELFPVLQHTCQKNI